MDFRFSCLCILAVFSSDVCAEEPRKAKTKTEEALAELKLPGIQVNLEERSVDVISSLCLKEGALEFVACTKGTKEHESILSVEAKPSHIHVALLLLGAKAGHPALRKTVGEGGELRFVDVPPKGSSVSVSFVIIDKKGAQKEHPLSHFVTHIGDEGDAGHKVATRRLKSFLFAGSHLRGKEGVPKTYVADVSGSVISLSTFGDELLCLPGVYGHGNDGLQWEVNPEHLPEIGEQIILRLRPQ